MPRDRERGGPATHPGQLGKNAGRRAGRPSNETTGLPGPVV